MNNRHQLKKPDGPIQGTLEEQNKFYYELEKNRSVNLQWNFKTTMEKSFGIKGYCN